MYFHTPRQNQTFVSSGYLARALSMTIHQSTHVSVVPCCTTILLHQSSLDTTNFLQPLLRVLVVHLPSFFASAVHPVRHCRSVGELGLSCSKLRRRRRHRQKVVQNCSLFCVSSSCVWVQVIQFQCHCFSFFLPKPWYNFQASFT